MSLRPARRGLQLLLVEICNTACLLGRFLLLLLLFHFVFLLILVLLLHIAVLPVVVIQYAACVYVEVILRDPARICIATHICIAPWRRCSQHSLEPLLLPSCHRVCAVLQLRIAQASTRGACRVADIL